MRRPGLWIVVLVVILPPAIFAAVLMGIGGLSATIDQQLQQQSCQTSAETVVSPTGVSLSPSGLMVKEAAMKADQAKIAAKIAGIIASRNDDFPGIYQHKATVIALATAIVESRIRNLLIPVDLDSVGVFQQRPSQGWGTYAQVTNVTYATNAFLNALLKVPNWQSMAPGKAAQAVQRSGVPDAYAHYIGQAEAIYSHLQFKGGAQQIQLASDVMDTGNCEPGDPSQQKIDAAVQACLSKLGSDYTWKQPVDGASLVSWCYQQAGVNIPDSIAKLATWSGDSSTGVQTTWTPASAISSGSNLQAGDILLWSDKGSSTDRAKATMAGMDDGLPLSDFTVATYNLLDATSHLAESRRIGGCDTQPVSGDPTCGITRAKREAEIISGSAGIPAFDIVGTQETSGIQYAELKKDLTGYHAYPDDSSRMNSSQDGAVAIFYNASKFTQFDQGTAPAISNTSQYVTNPWVGLRTSSGHRIYVMSIHYANGQHGGTPASILRSSRLTMQWVRSKVGPNTTVIVMGDFNDQPSQKLSYCVYTAGGHMDNASAMAAQQQSGCGHTPPFNGIDQIYATPGDGLKASGFKHLASNPTLHAASDHTPTFVTFHLLQKVKTSPFGNYIGPRASSGKIGLLAVHTGKLLGAIRLTIVAPSDEGDTGPWQSPLHVACIITQGYGSSNAFVGFHDGVDCGVPTGTPVYAAHSGTVFKADYDVAGGNTLVIDISGQVGTGPGPKYEHLSAFAPGVIPGVRVAVGQLVGYSGETGANVTGPHLHISECTDVTACLVGSAAQGRATVDPIAFYRAHGVDLTTGE